MLQRPRTSPCVDCGTVFGAPHAQNTNPDALPARPRGLCLTCYYYHQARGTLAQFPRLNLFPATARQFGVRLRHPGERRAEKRAEIAARIARHEGAAQAIVEGDDFDHWERRAVAESLADNWGAAHPDQRAEWDTPAYAHCGATNAAHKAA